MNKKLTGKAALVTGGSRGIGAAIARSLAEDGADVAISYVSSPDKAKALVRELQEKGVRAVSPSRPISPNPAKSAQLVNKVAEHFGHLDILVNNAGVFITGPVGEVSDDDVAKQFAINVGGVNAAVREAAKIMTEGGRIITIGSMAAITLRRGPASPTIRRPRARCLRTRVAGRAISARKESRSTSSSRVRSTPT